MGKEGGERGRVNLAKASGSEGKVADIHAPEIVEDLVDAKLDELGPRVILELLNEVLGQMLLQALLQKGEALLSLRSLAGRLLAQLAEGVREPSLRGNDTGGQGALVGNELLDDGGDEGFVLGQISKREERGRDGVAALVVQVKIDEGLLRTLEGLPEPTCE